MSRKKELRAEIAGIDPEDEFAFGMKRKELAMVDSYKPQSGENEARELVAELLNEYYSLGIDGTSVALTVGATNSLFLSFMV